MNLGRGSSPIPSRLMIVGEAWGEEEENRREPFVGASGSELNRMLGEAGIMRSEAFCTNLVNARPPTYYLAGKPIKNDIGQWIALKKKSITSSHVEWKGKMVLPIIVAGYEQLLTEIAAVQPNLIIAAGNWAMFALTGRLGIMKWRGSQLMTVGLQSEAHPTEIKVIPMLHPAAILREWSARAIALNDLRRAKRHMTYAGGYDNKPDWRFIIRPSFETAMNALIELRLCADGYDKPFWLDFDIETKCGHIDCIGLSWSKTDAICIPMMSKQNPAGYWSLDEETEIVWLIYKLLTHPNVRVRWQNGLYDAQYVHRWWHFIPRGAQDTMISHHVAFSGMRKSLDFQASLYCDYYVQWKPDKSSWKEGG